MPSPPEDWLATKSKSQQTEEGAAAGCRELHFVLTLVLAQHASLQPAFPTLFSHFVPAFS